MSTPKPTQPASVAPGQIQFLDAIQPPLTAGSYTFEVSQSIEDMPNTVTPYVASAPMEIVAPRFTLDPTSISAVYPPANQMGTYENVLPHVVFTDFALPWSRNIDPGGGTDQPGAPPWLALLTVYQGEMAQIDGPQTVTVEKLVAPGAGIIAPDLGTTVDPTSQQPVVVVDVDDVLFQGIAPQLAELPFLAHARVVNTDGKVILGMDADGAFSLVVGNRVPGSSPTEPSTNTVLLVSLEGHQHHLPTGSGGGGKAGEKIRLALLGSWKFTCPPATVPGNFLGLMQALCNPGNGGVALLALPQARRVSGDAVAEEALQIGYVPLSNRLRDGEVTTSWYRGPAGPAPTQRDHAYGPYHSADHALHYDPETGLFDASYACAWEIGRLMALADGTFAGQLFDWRREYLRTLLAAILDADVRQPLIRTLEVAGRGGAAARDAGEPAVPGAGRGVRTALRDLFAALPSGLLAELPKAPPRARRPALRRLPGALPAEQVAEVLDEGADPLVLLLRHLENPET